MTTIALTPEGEAFLARVRDELADLPPDERDELLEDIESHLAEVAGEGEVALAARLGSAEEFAHELRNSAGLPPRAAVMSSRATALRRSIDALLRRGRWLQAHVDTTFAWRCVRGWLLAVAVAVVIGAIGGSSAWGHRHIWLPHAGLRGYGSLTVLAACVALSFWIASRAAAGKGIRLDQAASALALLAILPAAKHLDNPPQPRVVYFTPTPRLNVPGLAYNGLAVSNVYPYDRAGTALHDVMLYLPDGTPLNVGAQSDDPNRRYLVTRRSTRLYNSFPVRYFDAGTATVSHPNAGPRVRIPDILTPPLGSQAP